MPTQRKDINRLLEEIRIAKRGEQVKKRMKVGCDFKRQTARGGGNGE